VIQPDPKPVPRITKEHYERIAEGMTEKQVEAILGAPAGNYATGPVLSMRPPRVKRWTSPPITTKTWRGDWGWIEVGFDKEGSVCSKSLRAGSRLSQGAR
jgi:hypothetical protein